MSISGFRTRCTSARVSLLKRWCRPTSTDKLAKGETISGTKEEIVMTTHLKSAVARNEEVLKQMMKTTGPVT